MKKFGNVFFGKIVFRNLENEFVERKRYAPRKKKYFFMRRELIFTTFASAHSVSSGPI